MISGPRSWRPRAKSASRSAASKRWHNRISFFDRRSRGDSASGCRPGPPAFHIKNGEYTMLKGWGRNTSSDVQKVMWAIGELGLEHERVDIGGKFGGNK